jgi:hypothetical protein
LLIRTAIAELIAWHMFIFAVGPAGGGAGASAGRSVRSASLT